MNKKIKNILNTINTQNQKYIDWKNRNLIRILTIPEIFILSYKRIENKVEKLDRKKLECVIEHLIKEIKDEKYKITLISNKDKQDYNIKDKLVQEAVKIILSSIFDLNSNTSIHNIIKYIKTWVDTKWFILGQIKTNSQILDYEFFFKDLNQKIADDKFLRLIRKTIKIKKSNVASKNLLNPLIISMYINNLEEKYFDENIEKSQDEKLLFNNINYTLNQEINDLNYFLISVNGTKNDCNLIKETILNEISSYNLFFERIDIFNALSKGVDFLNFEIKSIKNKITINISIDKLIKKLNKKGYCNSTGFPISNSKLINRNIVDLIKHYSKLNQKLLSYYKIADDFHKMKRFQYILRYSLAKTIAHKKKTTITKVFKKYGKDISYKIDNKIVKFWSNKSWKKSISI